MKIVKIFVMIFTLMVANSLTSSASNCAMVTGSSAQNLENSGFTVSSSSNAGKSKKVHHKAKKRTSGKKVKK